MIDLYLTPTRRALLVAVYEKRVIEGIEDEHTWLVEAGYPNRKVGARIAEARQAGWVDLPDGTLFWRLTQAGREVLGWERQQREAVADGR